MTATDTKAPLPESAQRVTDHLRTLSYEKDIMMLPATSKISTEAAAGLGCSVTEIARSTIFRRTEDDIPVLVIASSANRVDEVKVFTHVDVLARADTRFVREKAGYTIGGVCPVGHTVKPVMLLDQNLFQYDSPRVTADHPRVMFNLTPAELKAMTDTSVTDIAQRD